MIFGFALLIILYLIWLLLVEGLLWKGILFFAGWFGIRYLLLAYVPASTHTTLIFSHPFYWATVIASGICVLALLTTKD